MTNESANESEFSREEERVEANSSVFKKELGLTDLVLTQILFIVGSSRVDWAWLPKAKARRT